MRIILSYLTNFKVKIYENKQKSKPPNLLKWFFRGALIIVTRENLENLPYSIEEIYGICTSGKYANLKQVYHEFYKIYGNIGAKEISFDKIKFEF